ncbi:hypothetical protein A6A08_09140 [Nocardiopsis sp. TSRI0078]|uniref:hypothetical protein n=1 Tax=unclassified Nocardiopsis TaxID=2649073 RepID=UPI00093BB403|nr:hypothetical protein [Nocardiopsis sp. TSRI0078]OKI15721.1 hypothetical protein A6A08_09140 [Nocardiopsis sp. TSRI0078]
MWTLDGPDPIVRALTALGLPPVFDPEHRPGGARDEDEPVLAESLIAAGEMRAGPAPVPGRGGAAGPWGDTVQDREFGQALLYRRLERTIADWQWATDAAPSRAGAAAEAAMFAAHALVAAHADPDSEHTEDDLAEAEESLQAALVLVRAARPAPQNQD